MSWKRGRKLIEARRARVARLRLRGLTAREIVDALAHGENAMLNPESGKAYSLGTIGTDLRVLQDQWLADAARDVSEHKAEQNAELDEVRRAAWAKGNLNIVLRALERKARLFGLDAPQRQELTGADGGPIPIEVKHDFTDDAIADILSILAETGALESGPEDEGEAEAQ